nr:MAG TPA: hypothetical protein [Caudoviricetes sp.]
MNVKTSFVSPLPKAPPYSFQPQLYKSPLFVKYALYHLLSQTTFLTLEALFGEC